MVLIAGILVALVAAFVATKLVNGSDEGQVADMSLGAIGAFASAAVLRRVAFAGDPGLALWSACVSVIGAVLVVTVYHAVSGRGSHA